MKTETQAGILVNVHIHCDDEYKCDDCYFNHTEACNDAVCSAYTRPDGQDVYFTKNISEFICCGQVDTCKQTCIPRQKANAVDVVSDDFPHDATTSKNWMNTAAQENRNTQYYQGLLDMCGPSLGISAYTAEDGSIHDSVLRAKVPLEVARLAFKLALAEDKIRSLQATIEMDSML